MSKCFSAETPEEFKEKVFQAIDEAKENGSATLEDDGELLQFAEVDGDIIIEDQSSEGASEVTRAHFNEDDDNDVVLSAVEIPEEAPTEAPSEEPTEAPTEEVKVESENLDNVQVDKLPGEDGNASDNLPSVTITRLPGEDGDAADDIVDELVIDNTEGIEDAEKAGVVNYSLKFKHFSEKRARVFAKIFSEMASPLQEIVEKANIDENVEVKFEGEQLKVMSVKVGTPVRTFSESGDEEADLTKIIDLANELSDLAEDITKENAEEVKEKAESLVEECEKCECDSLSLKSIKSYAKKFSEEAANVLDQAEEIPTEEPTEAPTEEIVKTESEEDPTEEPTEAPTEEVKTESELEFEAIDTDGNGEISKEEWVAAGKSEEDFDKADTNADGVISKEEYLAFIADTKTELGAKPTVKQCEETGKWFIEEDPEKVLYDTQEEAEQVAAKMFSEPTVEVTIKDLEPASVADLLRPAGETAEPVAPVDENPQAAPAVDPNEAGTFSGRSFSIKAAHKEKSVNPLLFTEIK
jgi:nitrate/TMAO reductase-like tetraheme cytochrome c subunit